MKDYQIKSLLFAVISLMTISFLLSSCKKNNENLIDQNIFEAEFRAMQVEPSTISIFDVDWNCDDLADAMMNKTLSLNFDGRHYERTFKPDGAYIYTIDSELLLINHNRFRANNYCNYLTVYLVDETGAEWRSYLTIYDMTSDQICFFAVNDDHCYQR
jgi:hypothetical protein